MNANEFFNEDSKIRICYTYQKSIFSWSFLELLCTFRLGKTRAMTCGVCDMHLYGRLRTHVGTLHALFSLSPHPVPSSPIPERSIGTDYISVSQPFVSRHTNAVKIFSNLVMKLKSIVCITKTILRILCNFEIRVPNSSSNIGIHWISRCRIEKRCSIYIYNG